MTPDSKAPSSFEPLMKTHSTALTRPWSEIGVSIVTAVARMFMLIMSTKPVIASIASESGSERERPNTIVARTERRDDEEQRPPGAERQRPPRNEQSREERTGRRRRAQQAEHERAASEDRLREHRRERDRVSEEDGDEVEQDRAEHDPRAPDEADAGDEAVPVDPLLASARRDGAAARAWRRRRRRASPRATA